VHVTFSGAPGGGWKHGALDAQCPKIGMLLVLGKCSLLFTFRCIWKSAKSMLLQAFWEPRDRARFLRPAGSPLSEPSWNKAHDATPAPPPVGWGGVPFPIPPSRNALGISFSASSCLHNTAMSTDWRHVCRLRLAMTMLPGGVASKF